MVLDSFPSQPLSSDAVNVIAQQDRIENVYGMVTGDVTEEPHGFDVNIGLNVDGGVDHDFFFDLVIDTGDTITIAAYPRPNLPGPEDTATADDPRDLLTQDDHGWERIYQEPKAETSIEDVVTAFNRFRDFSDRETTWVKGLAHSGVLDFIEQ